MQLKTISESFLPHLLQKEFGKELFTQLEENRQLMVKSSAGSASSIFAAELFLIKKKSVLFLTDDKEDALYITTELEDLLGKENVLYFPPTHLEPYQIEKTQRLGGKISPAANSPPREGSPAPLRGPENGWASSFRGRQRCPM